MLRNFIVNIRRFLIKQELRPCFCASVSFNMWYIFYMILSWNTWECSQACRYAHASSQAVAESSTRSRFTINYAWNICTRESFNHISKMNFVYVRYYNNEIRVGVSPIVFGKKMMKKWGLPTRIAFFCKCYGLRLHINLDLNFLDNPNSS